MSLRPVVKFALIEFPMKILHGKIRIYIMTQKTIQNMTVVFGGRAHRCLAVFVSLVFSFLIVRAIFHTAKTGHPSATLKGNTGRATEIPNIVHYVHIIPLDTDGESPSIEFQFRHFISFYSAYFYLKPETIYIHTNVGPHIIQQARESSNPWTYAIANLPVVEFHYEEAPTHNTAGLLLEDFEHRADFIRTRVMKAYGGVYIDEDIYILKDLRVLRHAGFHNVVGMQLNEVLCNAMFLATPESDLITAWNALQDDTFDGGWTTHGNELLTRLVTLFAARDYQVLIMEQAAFFPSNWGPRGLDLIYGIQEPNWHEEELRNEITHPLNLTSLTESFKLHPVWRGELPLSESYALHGWNHAIGNVTRFGEFGGITLEYVLARSSNFARAVYPAVKHALDQGVIRLAE
jgi:hypothetical protein